MTILQLVKPINISHSQKFVECFPFNEIKDLPIFLC